jgi:ferrochelatase
MAPDVTTGVLLTAFGGPDSLDSVGPFMTQLMEREPSPEAVARAKAKYQAIGGCSPLTPIACDIARALEDRLTSATRTVPVRVGMRYWEPYIVDAMTDLADAGCTRVVMASLSAFESKVACGAYREAAQKAVANVAITGICETPSLHNAPEFRSYLAKSAERSLDSAGFSRPLLVMTAHSLPVGDLVDEDPYVSGLREVADAVALHNGLAPGAELDVADAPAGVAAFGSLDGPTPWLVAYQSKGMRPGAWLEPDISDVFAAASESGHDGVVVCPIGFATDHMETLYDLDIVARKEAEGLGLGFVRASVPNESEELVEALAGLVEPML